MESATPSWKAPPLSGSLWCAAAKYIGFGAKSLVYRFDKCCLNDIGIKLTISCFLCSFVLDDKARTAPNGLSAPRLTVNKSLAFVVRLSSKVVKGEFQFVMSERKRLEVFLVEDHEMEVETGCC